MDEDEPGIQRNLTEKSVSINTNKSGKSKQGFIPWEEECDYAMMNERAAEDNKGGSPARLRCCKHCSKKPTCCNCCMCAYLCLFILLSIGLLIIGVIYGVAPKFSHIAPEIQNVYIQLFDYHIGADRWKFGNDSVTKIFLNATGAFAVEAKNPNFAGFYMHDWSLDAISTNLYQNPEQWGNVYCCADHPEWNHSNKYIPGNYTFAFEEKQWFGAHDVMNMTFVLFVDHLSEELFYVAWQASFENAWRLPLTLHGGGWGKAKILGIDVKIIMDCDIVVNSSYFLPFDPPTPPPFIKQESTVVDMDENGNVEMVFDDQHFSGSDDDSYSFLVGIDRIGQVPPKKYTWQKFPVLNLTCSYGVGGLRF